MVSIAAWRMKDRIGEAGMLTVYMLVGASLVLVTTRLVDFCDFTILGDGNDAITGLLLGGMVAYSTIGVIAVRLSDTYPGALTIGVAVSALTASLGYSYVSGIIESDAGVIVTIVAVLMACFTILCTSYCRRNLSDNQVMAVATTAWVFLLLVSPGDDENLAAYILVSIMGVLQAFQFIIERRECSRVSRLLGLNLLLRYPVGSAA